MLYLPRAVAMAAAAADAVPPPALLRSIAAFLARAGYKRTLAALKSEAGLQENVWKSSSINLEDLFQKSIQESGDHACDTINQKMEEGEKVKIACGKEKSKKNAEGSKASESIDNEADGNEKKRRYKPTKSDTNVETDPKSFVNKEPHDAYEETEPLESNRSDGKKKKKKAENKFHNESGELLQSKNIEDIAKRKLAELKSVMVAEENHQHCNPTNGNHHDGKKKKSKAAKKAENGEIKDSEMEEVSTSLKMDKVSINDDPSHCKKEKKKGKLASGSAEVVETIVPESPVETEVPESHGSARKSQDDKEQICFNNDASSIDNGEKKMKKSKSSAQMLSSMAANNVPIHVEDHLRRPANVDEGNGATEICTNEDKKATKKRKKNPCEGGNGAELHAKSDEIQINGVSGTVKDSEDMVAAKRRRVEQNDVVENGCNEESTKVEETTSKRDKKTKTKTPKSVTPYQRVNAEEVEFVDERLQDNSYWAKDGADSGYGAKAQEILGQVKGRNFRHEKTKKKRGSYRGGQIDLRSHSIKFNYSDDE